MIFRPKAPDHEQKFERHTLLGILLSPFYLVGHFFGELLAVDDSIQVEHSFLQRSLAIITLPIRLLLGFGWFIVSTWSTSRNGRAFLKSIPVLLALGTFGASLLLADLVNTERKQLGLARGYIEYHRSNSPQFCEMFARKLTELQPLPENLYQLGLAYDRMNEQAEAYDVMRSLAPEEGGGLSLAHLWLSQYYARAKDLEIADTDNDEQAKKHLRYALQMDPNNQMARYSMAMIHIDDSKKFTKDSKEYREAIEKAIDNLNNVIDSSEGKLTMLELVAIPKKLELQIEIRRENENFKMQLANEIIRLSPLADRYPDVFEIRVTMVKCAVLMEDYSRALDIIREGYQLARDLEVQQKIVGLAALVYLDRANKYDDLTDREQYRGRLFVLCEAVIANPNNKSIYLELLKFIGSDSSEADTSNDQRLKNSLAGAKNPAILHGLLGLQEISSGNVLTGEKHWRIAEQQYNKTKLILSNLLEVVATDRPEQFNNIVDMISLAIEMFSDEPRFYRTRGIYFANQGRYVEAIDDLSYASEKLPNFIDIHQHLISCYEQTGNESALSEQMEILETKLGELNATERRNMQRLIDKI